MKKYNFRNKLSVVIAVIAMGVFSCQTDHLNPVPQTSISDLVAFNTPDRIALQVNNLYTSVKSGNFLGGRYQIYGDIRADDFLNRTSNAVTGYTVWNHTITETSQNDDINMWTAAYAAINQLNVFIKGMDDNKGKFVPPTFAPDFATTAQQYVGEAYLLRALSYHCLLQFYARPFIDGSGSQPGLPLRLNAEKNSLNNALARSSVSDIYDQIISDLNLAEQNLPLSYTTQTLNVTRAHRNTAIALKTRVYLTKGDYANVITEANKIVSASAPFVASSGVAHALQANVNNVFATPQETSESILSMPFTAQNTPGTQNQIGFYYRSGGAGANPGGGEYSLNAAGILADAVSFPATDARRTNFVYKVGTEFFCGKYPSGTPYIDKAPVIRYAEVLLNLSEAIARTTAGVDPKSLALLNAVRTRSTGVTGTLAPPDNATLLTNIMTERRIEFLGEGLRNSDIMRFNQAFPGKGAIASLPNTSAKYAWPIPITELQTNTAIVQNQ
ncbi:MAG TPA: RagB/SusD family nutrient uptake outer membrane protein [Cyclobacteriaceae bacterium]|nr:RagB/SusD family nutrient uptake outer membrane protein [Cyclobacteriaceae bacterium]